MEGVAMSAQPQAAPMTDALQALAGLNGVNGGVQGEGGFEGMFAALLEEMAGQMGGEDVDALLALLGAGKSKDGKDDLATMLGMQMMADGMIPPQMLEQFLAQAGETQLAAGGSVEGLLDLIKNREFPLWGDVTVPGEENAAADEELSELLETLTTEWQGQTAAPRVTDTLEDRLYFQSALRQAQQAVAEKPRAQQQEDTPVPDIEALQQAVDSRQFLAGTPAAESTAAAPSVQQVADQLKTGILENLRQGSQQFVVRLKPSGMGEITVRFTEDKNTVSLRIVTSNAAVGRMLANDVAQLQNALRPLNAQVEEIVTVPQTAESSAAQAQLAGEQQGQYARHYQNEHTGSGTPRETEEFEQAMEEAAPDDAALNLLI